MNNIIEFFKKWGIIMATVFSLCAMWNSCGTTGRLDRTNKYIQSLERSIHDNDSIAMERSSIEREISNNEIAFRVVYDNNSIVRTAARPDDVMNKYSEKIKELQDKLNKLKDAGKQ